MDITEVDVSLVKPQSGLIAFASVVLADQLYLSGIGIYQKLDGSGYRLTCPTRKVGDGSFQVFHPIRKGLGIAIERAVIAELKDVLSKRHAGHDSTHA